MKVRVFIKGDEPIMREAQELAEKIKESVSNVEIEVVDAESKDGMASCEAYKIFRTPTVLLTVDDGSVVNVWEGIVPSEGDLRGYLSL